MLASIIIRTYNEEKHLEKLLISIQQQEVSEIESEIVVVDSGSTDRTLEIAGDFNARITHIEKEKFTFGRSLNLGCDFAFGDYLIFISGHCIPVRSDWLSSLIQPLIEKKAVYCYGRQVGNDTTKFSEEQVFKKYFPEEGKTPQEGFFCNNANASLSKATWLKMKFDENLTGLEDMQLAKRLVDQGHAIAYVADAPVYHIHNERWGQIKMRYEREAIALQKIMPQVHISFYDFVRYFLSAVVHDSSLARKEGKFLSNIYEIIMFRLMQYRGVYKGNHEHRKLSAYDKEKYFYPK